MTTFISRISVLCCGQLGTISDQQYVFSFSLVDATYMTFFVFFPVFYCFRLNSIWCNHIHCCIECHFPSFFSFNLQSVEQNKGKYLHFYGIDNIWTMLHKMQANTHWIQWQFCNVLFWTLSNKWRKICEGVNMCVCLWFECTYRVVIQRFTIYVWLLHTLCAYCTIYIRLASVDASFYWMGAPWFGRKYIYPIQ